MPYAESRERFAETLEIVRRAWTEDSFSFEGEYFQFHDVSVVPKPYQKPHPPIRVAATSPDTFPTIGAQGHAIFAAVRLGTLWELGPNIKAYRAAYAAAGHPGTGQVFLRVPVYVADTVERALDEPRDSIMQFYRQLGEQLEASASEPARGRSSSATCAAGGCRPSPSRRCCAKRSSSARRRWSSIG